MSFQLNYNMIRKWDQMPKENFNWSRKKSEDNIFPGRLFHFLAFVTNKDPYWYIQDVKVWVHISTIKLTRMHPSFIKVFLRRHEFVSVPLIDFKKVCDQPINLSN